MNHTMVEQQIIELSSYFLISTCKGTGLLFQFQCLKIIEWVTAMNNQ